MITEDYIDEGVIPMNMNWRAGIGQDVDIKQAFNAMKNHDSTMHDTIKPYNTSVNSPWNQEDPLLPGKEDLYDGGIRLTYSKDNSNNVALGEVPPSFYQDLMYEIDTQVTDIQDSYDGKELDSNTQFEYRDRLKKACQNIKARYGKYLKQDFYDNLYNICMGEYNSNFAGLRNGVNPTVEFVDANKKIYANPLLIYQYFQL